MVFEWDDLKAEINFRKHGVSFEEARLVFFDDFALEEYDTDHSTTEESRYKLLGMGSQKIIFVVYAVRDEIAETYRIISARKADKTSEKVYWNERKTREK